MGFQNLARIPRVLRNSRFADKPYLIDDRAWYQAKVQAEQEQLAMQMLEAAARGEKLDKFGREAAAVPTILARGLTPMTNDLQLDIEDVTNGVVSLTVLNPTSMTNNPVWDLYATTNLSVEGSGLSATNWTWLARTQPGQTNLLMPMLSETEGYFRLANTNDVDGDMLTDAFELLVSHTSPSASDTDGDGMPDGWERSHGLNPLDMADGADDPDGDWLTNLQEYNGGANSTDPNNSMVLEWGLNHNGQLIAPQNLRGVTAVAGGFDFSLALQSNGTVSSWGYSTNIFNGDMNVVQIAAKAYHALALKADGTVLTWGDWWPSSYVFYPASVPPGLSNVVAVAAGADHDLALLSDGSVVAWGYYYNSPYNPLPTNLPPAKGIAAGWEHSVVLLQDGTLRAFGPILFGITNVPVGLSNVASIATGAYHTLALKADGTVVAWGAGTNNSGTLFSYGQSLAPASLTNVVAVSAAAFESLALKADGTIAVWGNYAVGAFPFGNALGLIQEPISVIGGGDEHALALRTGRLLPLVTAQPTNKYTLAGATISFSAGATGLAGVKYQWQFNGVNMTGAMNATLTLANVSTNNGGNYRVVVSTGAGSVTTSNALLAFLQPPTILSTTPTAPGSFVASNLNFRLSVAAFTTPGFTNYYQWYQGGVLISNATATNYSVSWGQTSDFTVKVWNLAGTNTSAAWTISNPSNMISLYDALWSDWHARTNGRTDAVLASIDEIAGSGGTMATNGIWNTRNGPQNSDQQVS